MSYYAYLANSTFIRVVLRFFLSLRNWLLVNYIYIFKELKLKLIIIRYN